MSDCHGHCIFSCDRRGQAERSVPVFACQGGGAGLFFFLKLIHGMVKFSLYHRARL